MARCHVSLAVVCGLALAPGLGGCVGVAVVGGVAAAGGAGYEAAQERGVTGTASDFNLTANVQRGLANSYGELNVTVYEGRVLLTGSSPTPDMKAQAGQIASRMPGVRAVYNEIEVAPPEEGWEIAKDSWITTRVRSGLVLESDVRSPNYVIETDRQSVYLIGSARTQAELDRTTQVARYVPDVRRVVSYVEIRPGAPQTAAPPPGPGPGYPNPGPGPAAGPGAGYEGPPPGTNAPIAVQKL